MKYCLQDFRKEHWVLLSVIGALLKGCFEFVPQSRLVAFVFTTWEIGVMRQDVLTALLGKIDTTHACSQSSLKKKGNVR